MSYTKPSTLDGMTDCMNDVMWLRPNEVIKLAKTDQSNLKAKFIDQGTSSSDVAQGTLGDCWFIGSLSCTASDLAHIVGYNVNLDPNSDTIDEDTYLKIKSGTYPQAFRYYKPFGIYIFKFYKMGAPVFVIVDDKLPTNNIYVEPLFFGCCPSYKEYWLPLIEKAYAKLHSSYEAIVGGQLYQGVIDLTGFISKKINIKKPFEEKEGGLWEEISKSSKQRYLMGCSIAGAVEGERKDGLLTGHAYSIIGT